MSLVPASLAALIASASIASFFHASALAVFSKLSILFF